MISRIFLASKNPGKISEASAILGRFGIRVEGTGSGISFPEETGATFRENAGAKAHFLARAVNGVVVGEDSGLVVPFLEGRPGVHSARFAGDSATDSQNIEKLLYSMSGARGRFRAAYFVCMAAVLFPGGKVRFFEGRLHCAISLSPRGGSGFGYDPVFEIPLLGKTMAELTPAEKNRRSHRARAFEKIGRYLQTAV